MTEIINILKLIDRALEKQQVTEVVKLNNRLRESEIIHQSKQISFIFPDEIYQLYKWHDGLLKEFNYLSSCEGSFNFLSLKKAIDKESFPSQVNFLSLVFSR